MPRYRVTLNFDVLADEPLDAIKQAHNAMLQTPTVMWDVWDVDTELPGNARPVLIDVADGIEAAKLEYAAEPGVVEPGFGPVPKDALPSKG